MLPRPSSIVAIAKSFTGSKTRRHVLLQRRICNNKLPITGNQQVAPQLYGRERYSQNGADSALSRATRTIL